MPITINGTGTITGISAGGLPDATVTTADIVDANVTAAKLSGAQSGAAPVYGCRAWVNFVGSTGAINASGNVTSVTRNSAGNWTVNFTTAMVDANYAVVVTGTPSPNAATTFAQSFTTGSCAIGFINIAGGGTLTATDPSIVSVAIFR